MKSISNKYFLSLLGRCQTHKHHLRQHRRATRGVALAGVFFVSAQNSKTSGQKLI